MSDEPRLRPSYPGGPFVSLRSFFARTGRYQRDIAADAGITAGYMSLIVNGRCTPSMAIAKRLSRLTNVPIEAIGKPDVPESAHVA